MMHQHTTSFLIHQRAYLERKQWLTLLTEEAGLVVSLQQRSAKKSFLQPFQPLQIQLKQRAQKWQVSAIEPQGFLPPIQPKNLWLGQYINELIYRLYQPDMCTRQVFHDYKTTRQQLSLTSCPTRYIRQFEHQLQDHMGYGLCYLRLEQDLTPWWYFSPEEGLIPSHNSIQAMYSREHLLQLREGLWQHPEVQQTSKSIFIRVLKHVLGHEPLFIKHLVPQSGPVH